MRCRSKRCYVSKRKRVKILFLEIYTTQLLLLTRTNIFVCLICFILLFESFFLLSYSLLSFLYFHAFLSLSSFYRSLSSFYIISFLYRHLFYNHGSPWVELEHEYIINRTIINWTTCRTTNS